MSHLWDIWGQRMAQKQEIMRTWYGTFMGHMGHELDGIQWGLHITGGHRSRNVSGKILKV